MDSKFLVFIFFLSQFQLSFPQEATTALSGGCTRLYDFETGSVDGWTWQPLDNSSYSQTGISLTSQYYQSGSHGLMLSWNSVNYAWATYYTNTTFNFQPYPIVRFWAYVSVHTIFHLAVEYGPNYNYILLNSTQPIYPPYGEVVFDISSLPNLINIHLIILNLAVSILGEGFAVIDNFQACDSITSYLSTSQFTTSQVTTESNATTQIIGLTGTTDYPYAPPALLSKLNSSPCLHPLWILLYGFCLFLLN